MPTTYVADAKQRFTEFGGFAEWEPAALPESVATWADGVLVRQEDGLTTLVALMTVAPEGAMKMVRDDLTVMADRISRQDRTDVQAVLLIIMPEPLFRQQYERWQELKVNRGAVRLVPWVVDLTRSQVFMHQGPPFGIDPDLETLAAPMPRAQETPPVRPAAVERDEAYPTPWVTLVLLALLGAIWIAMTVLGGSLRATESLPLLADWGAVVRPFMWLDNEFWRLLTACFLHIGIVHLAMNGLSLWMVGRAVEWLYGRGRMLFIYLAAGVAGSLASSSFGPPVILSAGASGAIFGLLGAIVWYRISSPLGDRIRLRPLVTTLLLNVGLAVGMYKVIDSWNHAGGLVGGFLAAAAVGVPAVAGLPKPRWQPGRVWRSALTTLVILTLGAYVSGLAVPPGPGRDLARGLEAYSNEQYDQAAPILERAVRQQEDEPYIREYLLRTYLHQGKCAQAQGQLIQIRSLDPSYTDLPTLELLVKQCRA